MTRSSARSVPCTPPPLSAAKFTTNKINITRKTHLGSKFHLPDPERSSFRKRAGCQDSEPGLTREPFSLDRRARRRGWLPTPAHEPHTCPHALHLTAVLHLGSAGGAQMADVKGRDPHPPFPLQPPEWDQTAFFRSWICSLTLAGIRRLVVQIWAIETTI